MALVSHKVRWLGMGLVLAWSLSHAAVFGGEKTAESPAEKVKKALDQPIVLDFAGNSLQEGLQHLKEKTRVNFEVDYTTLQQMGILIPENMVPTPVNLKSDRGGKVRQSLMRMLSPYNLSYVILDDTVLITTDEMGLHRQMRQRVAVDVNEQPLNTALKDLARRTALNLIIDPRVAKDAQTPVTLQMEDATLETAVRLLAELGNLKSVRMGNVLFVTSEARAEKIRREDAQTRPLHDPRFGPIPIEPGGFAPGGIGGAVVPAIPERAPVPPPNPDGATAPPAPRATPAVPPDASSGKAVGDGLHDTEAKATVSTAAPREDGEARFRIGQLPHAWENQ